MIEHARMETGDECCELFGDVAVMHVLVPLVHIDRMGAVPEFAPRGHAVLLSVISRRRRAASAESINMKRRIGNGSATRSRRWSWIPALASLGRNHSSLPQPYQRPARAEQRIGARQ